MLEVLKEYRPILVVYTNTYDTDRFLSLSEQFNEMFGKQYDVIVMLSDKDKIEVLSVLGSKELTDEQLGVLPPLSSR